MTTYRLLTTFLPCMLAIQIAAAQVTTEKRTTPAPKINPALNVNKPSTVMQVNTTPPDLVIRDMVLATDRKSIQVQVENIGEGTASPGSILLKPDHSPNIAKTTPSIAPHASKWITVPVPFNTYDFGEQYHGEVSVGNGIKESNVSNNTFSFLAPTFAPVSFDAPGTLPDLTILEIREPKVIDGKNLLKVRIVNRGGTDAGGFYTNFYYMIPSGGKEGGGIFTKALKAGEETFAMFELPMPDKFVYNYGKIDPNTHIATAILTIGGLLIGTVNCNTAPFVSGYICDMVKYRVMVDSQNTVAESDNSNNVLVCLPGGYNVKDK